MDWHHAQGMVWQHVDMYSPVLEPDWQDGTIGFGYREICALTTWLTTRTRAPATGMVPSCQCRHATTAFSRRELATTGWHHLSAASRGWVERPAGGPAVERVVGPPPLAIPLTISKWRIVHLDNDAEEADTT